MKVLFIRPFSVVFTKPYFTAKAPLNLGYLCAFLKQNGHEVRVLDLSLKQDIPLFRHIMNMFKPDLIGISAYTPNVLDGFEMIKLTKIIESKCITVMGGPHSTSIPEDAIEACPELDFVVIGEGEVTLLDLCNILEKGGNVNGVAGLCYRRNGDIIRTQPRSLIEKLDDLPFPDRDIIATSYRRLKIFDPNLNLPLNKIMEAITSRGCTDFCNFCTVHRAYTEKGRSLRLRSPENVLKEIETFRSKNDIRHISFLDDNFTINRERTRKVISGLKQMDLTWNCDSRVNLVDEDLIHEMVEAGCKKISIGVESGSDSILKLINKNITTDQARRVFKWCHEAKLETIQANFLIGSHPDETSEDVDKTRALIRELRPHRLLTSIIVPFPGTKVREQMLERNLIFSNDWRKYILMNDTPPPWRTTYFSSEELQRLQNNIIIEFYFNLRNMFMTLKYIKSFSILKVYFLSGAEVLIRYFIDKIKPPCKVKI
ncbi:MAG: radical SAM protein [Candidatus Omnitrophota bacterium]